MKTGDANARLRSHGDHRRDWQDALAGPSDWIRRARISRKHTNPLVAFKAHLENARLAAGACEIYFYKGGYGGLSGVEGGVSNLCFIVAANDVRRYGSDPELVLREVVMKNSRAAYTLAEATGSTPWLSVSLESFGRRTLVPAAGLLTIGRRRSVYRSIHRQRHVDGAGERSGCS